MEPSSTPRCIGFIMDGNRRWAKAQNLPTLEGHRKGFEVFQDTVRWVYRAGVPHLVCYAFSTENWNRSQEEVSYLMDILSYAVSSIREKSSSEIQKLNVRVVGQTERLSPELQNLITQEELKNVESPQFTIWVCISYGGRAEIVSATNRAIQKGIPVTEEEFSNLLWTEGMPDPDMVVRTSGEMRISNFLLWQIAYAELFFIQKHWPDLTEEDIQQLIVEYGTRHRRKGA